MAPTTRAQAAQEAVGLDLISSSCEAGRAEPQALGVRLREAESTRYGEAVPQRSASRQSSQREESDKPPRFTIDLSLPPEQRYNEICTTFKDEMLGLTSLFDEVVGSMVPLPSKWLKFLCRIFLRRVHNEEENRELKGISKATGVEMFLLVCFNVLLDLFMGCSSGGVAIRAGRDKSSGTKMVHFRTLDWGMPSLRKVVVQLDFVAEKNGPIIASSITYAGFVGVLTGVRKDLSVSLNFRPNRIDSGKFLADAKYGWHLLMVLLAKRPSISSVLRSFVLPYQKRGGLFGLFKKSSERYRQTYSQIISEFGGSKDAKTRPMVTTACYVTLCSGNETTVVEKDRISAVARSDGQFVVVTNSDETPNLNQESAQTTKKGAVDFNATLTEIITEAKDRQECARSNWANMVLLKARDVSTSGADLDVILEFDDIVEMVQKYPTTNEMTHFAAVMDPMEGNMRWCRRWHEPISAKWIRQHMSDAW